MHFYRMSSGKRKMFNLLSGEYSVFRIARADFPAAAPHSVFFLSFFARTAILEKNDESENDHAEF